MGVHHGARSAKSTRSGAPGALQVGREHTVVLLPLLLLSTHLFCICHALTDFLSQTGLPQTALPQTALPAPFRASQRQSSVLLVMQPASTAAKDLAETSYVQYCYSYFIEKVTLYFVCYHSSSSLQKHPNKPTSGKIPLNERTESRH